MSLEASRATLSHLPYELLASISTHLPNRDLKSLRLTCKTFCDVVKLRLGRVFLSANPRNIAVLLAVADHETYRRGVREIIWDDALLTDDNDQIYAPSDEFLAVAAAESCPVWFARTRKDNLDELVSRKGEDVDRPDHVARAEQVASGFPLGASWAYFQKLLKEQQEVIASGADETALRYALERFPSLKRITVTPAAHGWLFSPLYETPMIRAFPSGFHYRIPRGWPAAPVADRIRIRAGRDHWRGASMVMRILSQQQHHGVSELVLDNSELNSGFNCHIFDEPCDDYTNLKVLLRKPGFKRIDLSLLVTGMRGQGWHSFRNGNIRRAWEGAADLEHVCLRTNVHYDPDASATQLEMFGGVENDIALLDIFPVDKWQRLEHLGLSGFLVTETTVLSLLAALPPTLRSVELSFLLFLEGGGGDYRSLLDAIHATLGWRERAPGARPRVSIAVPAWPYRAGRAIWVDREANAFLYGDGANPFGSPDGSSGNQVFHGTGVERDAFEPAYERPWRDMITLMKMGYLKKSPIFFGDPTA